MAKNKTVSPSQIPQVFRAYRPRFIQFLARLLLKIFGWKVDGTIPEMKKNENLVLNCCTTYFKLGWNFWLCSHPWLRCKDILLW